MEIIEIKKDQQQYISEIAALESDIFPDPWSEKSIRDTLENPQARIWAIISRQAPPCYCASTAPEHASETAASCDSTAPEHAGKPQLLGYVIFYYVLDEEEIARIATTPQHRRQGVAVRLLEKMRAFSYEQNITRWLLDVRISNETAIHFYKAAGFAEDGVRKNFYANPPEDAILMSCEVETSGSDRARSLSKSQAATEPEACPKARCGCMKNEVGNELADAPTLPTGKCASDQI